jgi:dinuclear metal center YbgI/SA1388 family protein
MKLKDISNFLDSAIPLSYQESYDNSGLQVGDPEAEINSALLTLDVTAEVVEEAAAKKSSLIISHHPLIFSPIKKLTGKSEVERILVRAIKEGIAVYSAHTSLDVISGGVSRRMAEKLDLHNINVLAPREQSLLKLVVFIPENYLDKVKDAIFDAGAGVIGNYDRCSFSVPGTGSFRPGEKAQPFVGKKGRVHLEREVRFETVLFAERLNKVLSAMLKAHPYEEPAYDILHLGNNNAGIGLGCYGDLKTPIETKKFLALLAKVFGAEGIRYSDFQGSMISKVALCGGAGASLLTDAIAVNADAFVTADIRYHTFFEPESRILLADIGHYESEKFSSEILYDLIIKKFPTFALRFSEINTNPINYL